MAYAIMRAEKRHRAAVHGIMIEANRSRADHENGRDFVNSDINWDLTDSNVFLVKTENWNREITRVLHAEGLKERKDSVVLIDGLYTASGDFFDGKSREEILDFFRDCLKAHERLYGTPINAVVHFDEETPHMQVASVPIVTDSTGKKKLSAKELMGGRAQYQMRQDKFYADVGAKYGLERGEKVDYTKPAAERKRHTTKREHLIQQQEAQISAQKDELGDLQYQVASAQLDLRVLEMQTEDERRRAERVEDALPGLDQMEELAQAVTAAVDQMERAANQLGNIRDHKDELMSYFEPIKQPITGRITGYKITPEKLDNLVKRETAAIGLTEQKFILGKMGQQSHWEKSYLREAMEKATSALTAACDTVRGRTLASLREAKESLEAHYNQAKETIQALRKQVSDLTGERDSMRQFMEQHSIQGKSVWDLYRREKESQELAAQGNKGWTPGRSKGKNHNQNPGGAQDGDLSGR